LPSRIRSSREQRKLSFWYWNSNSSRKRLIRSTWSESSGGNNKWRLSGAPPIGLNAQVQLDVWEDEADLFQTPCALESEHLLVVVDAEVVGDAQDFNWGVGRLNLRQKCLPGIGSPELVVQRGVGRVDVWIPPMPKRTAIALRAVDCVQKNPPACAPGTWMRPPTHLDDTGAAASTICRPGLRTTLSSARVAERPYGAPAMVCRSHVR
jgi:hypothetical protein